jgi:hypothetical protein
VLLLRWGSCDSYGESGEGRVLFLQEGNQINSKLNNINLIIKTNKNKYNG